MWDFLGRSWCSKPHASPFSPEALRVRPHMLCLHMPERDSGHFLQSPDLRAGTYLSIYKYYNVVSFLPS